MGMVTERFDVFLVMLDSTDGSEIQKRLAPVGFPDAKSGGNRAEVSSACVAPSSEKRQTRPCLIISPNEMNTHLATVIIAPMTTSGKQYPSRIPVNFDGKDGFIALDHIRSVSKTRLVKHLGTISTIEQKAVIEALLEMFAQE
jgi:mRNA interferase MazF